MVQTGPFWYLSALPARASKSGEPRCLLSLSWGENTVKNFFCNIIPSFNDQFYPKSAECSIPTKFHCMLLFRDIECAMLQMLVRNVTTSSQCNIIRSNLAECYKFRFIWLNVTDQYHAVKCYGYHSGMQSVTFRVTFGRRHMNECYRHGYFIYPQTSQAIERDC